MIIFNKLSKEEPYKILKTKYDAAIASGQKNIEAISIASYNNELKEVDSRFVNLKFINGNKFIFFSNYKSPKSKAFKSHNQISALIFWSSLNVQIRMKGVIKKTSQEYTSEYFKHRAIHKNALAVSSNQSETIESYDNVISKYNDVLKSYDFSKCPDYWGGFSFIPYYFEFWEGHESRINKREVFDKINGEWKHSFLQP